MNIEEFKNNVRNFLGEMKIMTLIGEKDKIQKINNMIYEDNSDKNFEELQEEFNNISEYLIEKQENLIKNKDFEYLSNIAEILRNQKIRAEDSVYLANPVFKVTYEDETGKQFFYFLTKDAAQQFIETNQIWSYNLQTEKLDDDKKRKEKIFKVERNQNLELERLLEIIKRNF